jgi:hypothetical protein
MNAIHLEPRLQCVRPGALDRGYVIHAATHGGQRADVDATVDHDLTVGDHRRHGDRASVRPGSRTRGLIEESRRPEGGQNVGIINAAARGSPPRAPLLPAVPPSSACWTPAGAVGTAHLTGVRARRPRPEAERDAMLAHPRRQPARRTSVGST